MSLSRIVANLATNVLTRQQHNGREYAIAPAVLAKAGVLNGMLLPAIELAAFAEAWNGRPIPVRHPIDAAGNYISANSPAVLARQGAGQVFNVRMDGDRLLGELWLDVAQIRQLGGAALAALERMERGELVDVSTAYYHDTEAGVGSHAGRAYNGIQRNLRPDHVALLPDEAGACSVADGCGAPRVNCACAAPATNASVMDVPDGVMIAFFPDESMARQLALDPAGLPDGVAIIDPKEIHLTVCYLGKIDELTDFWTEESLLRELADAVEDELLLTGIVNGMGRFTAEEGELEPVFLNFDSPALTNFRMRLLDRMGWMLPRPIHGYTPHITLAYAPAGVDLGLPMPERTQITFDAISLAWGGNVTNLALRGSRREFGTATNTGDDPMKISKQEMNAAGATANNKAEEPAKDEVETPAAPALDTAAIAELAANAATAALTKLFAPLGGLDAFVATAQQLATNAQRERATRITRLAANAGVPFTAEQLTAMTDDVLAGIEAMAQPAAADYGALFAPGLATNRDEEWAEYEEPKAV